MAVGVRDDAEGLQTAKFTFPDVGQEYTSSHEYMFVPLGAAFSENAIVSEVAMPLVATVTVEEQAPEEMADVPMAVVPLANVVETVPDDGKVAVELTPVPPFALANSPVTCVGRLMTVVAAKQTTAKSAAGM